MKLKNLIMIKVNLDCISTSSRADARESCDVTMVQCRERFFFTYQSTSVQLFAASDFPSYQNIFPIAMLTETIRAYLFCDRERLRNELSVL